MFITDDYKRLKITPPIQVRDGAIPDGSYTRPLCGFSRFAMKNEKEIYLMSEKQDDDDKVTYQLQAGKIG